MAQMNQRCQTAIVDEVDSILVDEARTLITTLPTRRRPFCNVYDHHKLIPEITDEHFTLVQRPATLTSTDEVQFV
jgi:preprotein translocase subunit SecA